MDTELTKAKVTIAQFGARKHYQEPLLFHQWGMLDTLYTDFYARDNFINQFLRSPEIYSRLPKILKKMADRYVSGLNNAKIVDFPLLSVMYRQRLRKISNSSTNFAEDGFTLNIQTAKEFNRKIIARGLKTTNLVYAFDGFSLELLQFARNNGIRSVLDRTTAESSLAHRLLQQEDELWRGWSKHPFRFSSCHRRQVEREGEEQEIADHIVCGSDFVKKSLVDFGIQPEKVTVISLGSKLKDSVLATHPKIHRINAEDNLLKILFCGSLSLRKGVPYLLESLKILNTQIPFICKLAGDIDINAEKLQKYADFCEVLGRVPRSEMSKLYRWANVFVLPSICEGSAMVTYEAMMYGLPIITTYNSGSIIRDGIDGFIVPIRDSPAIAEALIKVFNNRLQLTHFQNRQDFINSVNDEAKTKLRHLIESMV
jgi:CRP-like cAMP-binding protein